MHPPSLPILAALAAATCIGLQACDTPPPSTAAVQTLAVNGVQLPYVAQGRGTPVVFVHGAVSDLRTWDRQRQAVARHYRAISYSQRYFGTEPWPPGDAKFGIGMHADDLAAFIQALDVGPVHVVGWSYGAAVGLAMTQQHPHLVKSAFLYEPSLATFVTDAEDLKVVTEDRAKFAPISQAVKAGDNHLAARTLLEVVDDRPGVFQAMTPAIQGVVSDNARTVPLSFGPQFPPPPISCAQLGQVRPPVAIVRGELSRPFFRVAADTAARCLPAGHHAVVSKARHMWPGDEPEAFSRAVLAFLRSSTSLEELMHAIESWPRTVQAAAGQTTFERGQHGEGRQVGDMVEAKMLR